MLPRKSCRHRTLSAKGLAHKEDTNIAVRKRKLSTGLSHQPLAPECLKKVANSYKRLCSDSKAQLTAVLPPLGLCDAEKRSSAPQLPIKAVDSPEDDKIDPVEKLLSMSSTNDILYMDSDSSAESPLTSLDEPATSSAYPSLSLNFTKAINDDLRLYYLRLRKSPMEIHNDHSSFSVLNSKPPVEEPKVCSSASQASSVPFFKNVNFSSTPSFQKLDDYIFCSDDEDDEPLSTDSEHEDLPSSTASHRLPVEESGKMSFHYRQNSNMNLSLSDVQTEQDPQDIFKFLTHRSVLSGRASEMIGTSTFMIKDFFF